MPARPHRRSRRNADEEQAERRALDALVGNVVDAIRAVVQQVVAGAPVPPGLEILRDATPTRRRRRTSQGIWVSEPSTRGRDAADWLLRQAAALDGCRYVKVLREAQCGNAYPLLNSCRSRVCVWCERMRSARVVAIMSAVLDGVEPRRRSFLVFTIRNVLVLLDGYRRLDRAWESLRRRPIWRGGRCRARQRDGRPFHPCAHPRHRRDRNCPDFRHEPFVGGARFDEVTFNRREKTYHPHRNVLADAPFAIQAELSDTWRALTCGDAGHRRRGWCPADCADGSPVVWMRRVRPGTVREAVKYVTKVTDLIDGDDPHPLVEFLLASRGRRMAQGFGSFFGLDLEELKDDEPTVGVEHDTGDHDSAGRPIIVRFNAPQFCRACGRDTRMPDGSTTYEWAGQVPRRDLRLHNGALVWPGNRPQLR
ncbi:MAG: hypothetical protein KGK34_07310 [Chloroflexota bacterium]|nr:hypothetical protein [Chloroflexota bacterium]